MDTKNNEPDKESILNLLNNGFKLIENSNHYYINVSGQVYNAKRQTYLKPYQNNKGYYLVSARLNIYNLAKLIIDYFGDTQKKTDYIRFKDNNKANLSIENIEYCSLSDLMKGKAKNQTSRKPRKPTETSPSILASIYKYQSNLSEKTLIRLLSSEFLKTQIEKDILIIRNETKDKYLYRIVLIDYVNGKSIESISNQYEISLSKTKELIKQARKQLKSEIETDIKNGLLTTFAPEPEKKPTLTQIIKDYNLQTGAKIPLRKKSKKELLKYHINHIQKFKEENGMIKPL